MWEKKIRARIDNDAVDDEILNSFRTQVEGLESIIAEIERRYKPEPESHSTASPTAERTCSIGSEPNHTINTNEVGFPRQR